MIVEVKPIDTDKWHGKKGKESFAQPMTIEVLYNKETGKYATGLSPEDVKKYGEKLGLDLSDRFDAMKPHPYWSTQPARIKLPNHTVIFNTEKSLDYIRLCNLKASKFVANSIKELSEGLWPEATHVIFSEEEEVEVKATKVSKKMECMKLAMDMSKDEKVNIVQILSAKSVRGRSENFVNVEIDSIIEDRPEEFLRFAKMDKQLVYTRASVQEALHRNVLTKEGSAVYYMGDKLANDVEDAVKYFMDPSNQKLKVAILEKLNK